MGIVHCDDLIHDNRWQPGETPVAGVKLELLDQEDRVIATTRTDVEGRYWFDLAAPGLYSVREMPPVSFVHGGEELGRWGGKAQTNLLRDIPVVSGFDHDGYNFSELPLDRVAADFATSGRIDPPTPVPAFPWVARSAAVPSPRVGDAIARSDDYFPSSVDGQDEPWRLNVLKPAIANKLPRTIMHPASLQANPLRGGKWILGDAQQELTFGADGAIPLVGDFNGDGHDELGVYLNGEWSLDTNGNRRIDDGDATIHLGTRSNQPVIGDWDGDGNDDIGVYASQDATPITGDFARSGHDRIGLFHNGAWQLDANGDGKLSSSDPTLHFGTAGDMPVVGDFDGDGRDEIGVFRNGQWIIDSNHNGQIDTADKVFELGGAGDVPVVGDFNGDGIDEPGLYRGSPAARISRTR